MHACSLSELITRIDRINPVEYAVTRNHLDGHVSRLSPFISRGVISTRFVFERLIQNGWEFEQSEKFIQELAWRDYWQVVWREKGDAISADILRDQPDVATTGIPMSIMGATTGIHGIDNGVNDLIGSGYVHNHQRMYIASAICNIAQSHWLIPAKWMYYHLLDGDWASNALSWQWVAGTFSSKKYYANQENIDKYCGTRQSGTFLDVGYDCFPLGGIPIILRETVYPKLTTVLPDGSSDELDARLPILIYTAYNLDPSWYSQSRMNRVLLLEPSQYHKYPVSEKVMEFILAQAGKIAGIKIFVGEFDELRKAYPACEMRFKEHPFNRHFTGLKEDREWMTSVQGHFPSFFSFWKRCRKELLSGK